MTGIKVECGVLAAAEGEIVRAVPHQRVEPGTALEPRCGVGRELDLRAAQPEHVVPGTATQLELEIARQPNAIGTDQHLDQVVSVTPVGIAPPAFTTLDVAAQADDVVAFPALDLHRTGVLPRAGRDRDGVRAGPAAHHHIGRRVGVYPVKGQRIIAAPPVHDCARRRIQRAEAQSDRIVSHTRNKIEPCAAGRIKRERPVEERIDSGHSAICRKHRDGPAGACNDLERRVLGH